MPDRSVDPAGVVVKPVTVMVARSVAAGRERDFLAWAEGLNAAAAKHRGFLGCGLLHPGGGDNVWNVVYRFDTTANLDSWERSAGRQEILEKGAEFVNTVAVRRMEGMDAWFDPAGKRPAPPPRWKTFLMTTSVILILQIPISLLVSGVVRDWPTILRPVVIIIPVVALMTWLVMPRLSKLLAGWLYASRT